MKTQRTIYHIVVDKSGSMGDCIPMTIEGYNEQVAGIRELSAAFPEQDMQIGLIKSAETPKEVFTKVMDLLQSVPGPISFTCDPESLIDFDDDDVTIRLIENLEEFGSKKFDTKSYKIDYESIIFPLNKPSVYWDTLFDKCRDYRKHHPIAQDAFVVLMTGISNDYNWFAHVDSHNGNNFISTKLKHNLKAPCPSIKTITSVSRF